MNKKKIGLVVSALALCICLASAAVWLLTVRVPITYEESLEFWFSDETQPDTWMQVPIGVETTTGVVNLTNNIFEDYLRAINNGKRPVGITVTITAYNATDDSSTNLIGFELVKTNASGSMPIGVCWGSITFGTEIPAATTVNGTLHYVRSNDSPLAPTYPPEAFYVIWEVSRYEP